MKILTTMIPKSKKRQYRKIGAQRKKNTMGVVV